MNCHELSPQLLSEYLDREISPELRLRIEEHLRECPRCRVQFRTIVTTVTLTGRLERRGAQQEMVVRLRRRIVRIDRGPK